MRLHSSRRTRRFPASSFAIFLCITALLTGGAFAFSGGARVALLEGSRQVVAKAAGDESVRGALLLGSTTTINSDNLDPSAAGQAVTVTFTVAPSLPNVITPTGNVVVTISGGSETCMGTLDANGQGQCQLTLTVTGSNRIITATYQGDLVYDGSIDTESHNVMPTVTIRDARAAEPPTGSAEMVFTVALSSPASQNVSVDFTTADDTGGANPATTGSDFTSSSGTITFLTGETLKVISVPALADLDNAETDETFLVTLSNPSPATVTIADGTGVGTITVANPAGALLISELRHLGTTFGTDDFIEIYNNSDSVHTVDSPDNTGYGIFKMGADCNAQPILIGTIPEGTPIPARGHFLLTGSSYSLKDYGGTNAAQGDASLTSDLEVNRNVALFSTATLTSLSTLNRLDAVGFGTNVGNVCNLLREGSPTGGLATNPVEHTFFRKQCDFVAGVGCSTPGIPKDTNANTNDFQFANPSGDLTTAGQRLGAPGPQNLSSPRSNSSVPVSLLDGTKGSFQSPNRQRFTNAEDPVAPFGALVVRRKFRNETGTDIAGLRFRVIEITTFPPQAGVADLRAYDSSDTNINTVIDAGTCAEQGQLPPCTVTVKGTTLEQPPVQSLGGGINSSLRVILGTPLSHGQTIPVQFRLGVHQQGTYNFCVLAEGLPNGGTQVFCDSGHTEGAPPTISKAFSSPTVPLNGTATLTFTITNPNAATQLNGVAFSDMLPAGLVVADIPNVTGVCNGAVTAAAGTDTISLSGGNITGGGNCMISVDVKGTSPGIKNNTTGPVSSTETGTGLPSNTAQIEVLRAPTSTGVASSNNPSNYAESVTFTATVTSGAGMPTGSVQFKDNGNNLGAPVALNGSGVAQISTNSLTPGSHTITADYLGDANFDISTGTLAVPQVVVNLAGWTTTGANGAIEDESNPARPTYTNFTAAANAGSPAGTYILRYNIASTGNLTLPGAVNTRFRVRFRDEGAGSRVTVAIIRSPMTGGATTIGTLFDSDTYAPGSGFQTQEILMPALTFDFALNTYWLEVILTKTDTSNQPGFGAAHINQQ